MGQGLDDPTDITELMRKGARVLVPYGEAVAAIIAHAENKLPFKCGSCKKPTQLKKMSRIIEKSVLPAEKDDRVDMVGDVVRMMAVVTKMSHVAAILRAITDDALVALIIAALPLTEDAYVIE